MCFGNLEKTYRPGTSRKELVTPAHHGRDVQIRPATPGGREFLHQIAPRLLVGYVPWRDATRMLATMEGFLMESLDAPPNKGAMFIAEQSNGTRLGVVSVAHQVNFTGERQAYLGELAVVEDVEGQGVGRVLVLDTGAANARVRCFYAELRYREDNISPVKRPS